MSTLHIRIPHQFDTSPPFLLHSVPQLHMLTRTDLCEVVHRFGTSAHVARSSVPFVHRVVFMSATRMRTLRAENNKPQQLGARRYWS